MQYSAVQCFHPSAELPAELPAPACSILHAMEGAERQESPHWSRLTCELHIPEKTLFCVTTTPNPMHKTKLLSFVCSIRKSSSAVKFSLSALQKDVLKQFDQLMKYSISLEKFYTSKKKVFQYEKYNYSQVVPHYHCSLRDVIYIAPI